MVVRPRSRAGHRGSVLGIDIGTSGTKAVLVEDSGKILGSFLVPYDIESPAPGYAEQDPETWWKSTVSAVNSLLADNKLGERVLAIGLSGQMHSAVFLGEGEKALCPSILWADTRTKEEAKLISERLGRESLFQHTANPMAVGFTATSLLWVKKHEPEIFQKLRKVILPKDYIRLKLTGEVGTEFSDACATGLFDVRKLAWSEEVLSAVDVPKDILPGIGYSSNVAGTLLENAAAELSLRPHIPVVYGGGDQPAQAVGNGVISPGQVSVTIGTGGQVFTPTENPYGDEKLRVHTFCHCLENLWYYMGATLSAGLSMKWFRDSFAQGISYTLLDEMAETVSPGSDDVIFLPYLVGERTPHMDPNARGIFFGLGLEHTTGHLARAVMEGVAFSLREALDIMKGLGVSTDEIIISGGGGKSPLWSRIISDVLGLRVKFPKAQEGSAFGAAIMAAVGAGIFCDIPEAIEKWVGYREEVIAPLKENRKIYDEAYTKYRGIYRRLKDIF